MQHIYSLPQLTWLHTVDCVVHNLTDHLGCVFLSIAPALIYLSVTDHLNGSEQESFRISLDGDQLFPDVSTSPDKGLASKLL